MANPGASKYKETWMGKTWLEFISIFFENELVQGAPVQGQYVASEVFAIMNSILNVLGLEESVITAENIAIVENYMQNFTSHRSEVLLRYEEVTTPQVLAQYRAEGISLLSFDELVALIPYSLNVHLGTNVPALPARK